MEIKLILFTGNDNMSMPGVCDNLYLHIKYKEQPLRKYKVIN